MLLERQNSHDSAEEQRAARSTPRQVAASAIVDADRGINMRSRADEETAPDVKSSEMPRDPNDDYLPRNQHVAPRSIEWSAKMESSIWAALQRSGRPFTSIDRVQCNEPTCEIYFTVARPAERLLNQDLVNLPHELIALVGRDENGEPIVKQANFGSREIYPGVRTLVIKLSTEWSDEQNAARSELKTNPMR